MRMFEGRKRKPPPEGKGKKRFPYDLSIIPPGTWALVARYFLATFLIMEKKVDVDEKKKYVAERKSQTEKYALRSLRSTR